MTLRPASVALMGLAVFAAPAFRAARADSPAGHAHTPGVPCATCSASAAQYPNTPIPPQVASRTTAKSSSAPRSLRLFGSKPKTTAKSSSAKGHAHSSSAPCNTCQAGAITAASGSQPYIAPMPNGSAMTAPTSTPGAPGYAVVDMTPQAGGMPMAGMNPGMNMIPAEPTPVGIMQTNFSRQPGMAGMPPAGARGAGMGQPAAYGMNDPSTVAGSPSIVAAPPSARPKIIKHLFGLPDLSRSGPSRARRDFLRKSRTDLLTSMPAGPVTELPGYDVYRR